MGNRDRDRARAHAHAHAYPSILGEEDKGLLG